MSTSLSSSSSSSPNNSFQCPTCNKSFKAAKYLKQHANVHFAVPKNYSCLFCGKKYTAETSLSRHKNESKECDRSYRLLDNKRQIKKEIRSKLKRGDKYMTEMNIVLSKCAAKSVPISSVKITLQSKYLNLSMKKFDLGDKSQDVINSVIPLPAITPTSFSYGANIPYPGYFHPLLYPIFNPYFGSYQYFGMPPPTTATTTPPLFNEQNFIHNQNLIKEHNLHSTRCKLEPRS